MKLTDKIKDEIKAEIWFIDNDNNIFYLTKIEGLNYYGHYPNGDRGLWLKREIIKYATPKEIWKATKSK